LLGSYSGMAESLAAKLAKLRRFADTVIARVPT
jgi:hypothetical protein